MDLVWHPGEAQADFGEVDVLLRGVVQRMHHFVLDFPYSNVGLVQLMPGENAECTCLALRNLFEWLGGVPERIVFDNAAGVGHKGYGEREPRLTHLFQAFQAHYGFDCSFCNPYSGHEKGAVESKVGMVRRKLFVPRPSVWSLENFNAGLPDRCLSWPRNRITARTRRNVACSPRTVRRCCRCPGSVSTWSRGGI